MTSTNCPGLLYSVIYAFRRNTHMPLEKHAVVKIT